MAEVAHKLHGPGHHDVRGRADYEVPIYGSLNEKTPDIADLRPSNEVT